MEKLTVALLSGGISSEREVSLNSGNQVYEALDKEKYEVLRYDPKTDLQRLVTDAGRIDVALVILHGPFGEDGTIQGLLDLLNIPYQGSGVLGSAVAMNKHLAKQLYRNAGLPVPEYRILEAGDPLDADEIQAQLHLPLVVKPVAAGSSVGMTIVRAAESIRPAVQKAFEFDTAVLLEAYIDGTEVTGGVIGNDKDLQALPLIEIVPDPRYEFFDYEAKYTPGATQEICPARIPEPLAEKARSYALKAHRVLCCKGYSRTDMILKDDELYVLETNTIPGMTATSLFPQAAAAGGLPFGALLDRLIHLSIESHKRK